jgi:hypothetical protein
MTKTEKIIAAFREGSRTWDQIAASFDLTEKELRGLLKREAPRYLKRLPKPKSAAKKRIRGIIEAVRENLKRDIPLSNTHIAEKFGVSRERVRQIIQDFAPELHSDRIGQPPKRVARWKSVIAAAKAGFNGEPGEYQTLKQIGKDHNLMWQQVHLILKKHAPELLRGQGIGKRMPRTLARRAAVIAAAKAGLNGEPGQYQTHEQIGRSVGIATGYVYRILKEHAPELVRKPGFRRPA